MLYTWITLLYAWIIISHLFFNKNKEILAQKKELKGKKEGGWLMAEWDLHKIVNVIIIWSFMKGEVP